MMANSILVAYATYAGSTQEVAVEIGKVAEDKFAFNERLAEITAPTLVAGGADDFFYSPALFRETAAGISNAELCLYTEMGHPAGGKRFRRDVLEFLRSE
jgi:pimeloyl-ACP methyl ester carboxylesterase